MSQNPYARCPLPDVRLHEARCPFTKGPGLSQMSSWPTIHHPIEIYRQTNRCLIEPTKLTGPNVYNYKDRISTKIYMAKRLTQNHCTLCSNKSYIFIYVCSAV